MRHNTMWSVACAAGLMAGSFTASAAVIDNGDFELAGSAPTWPCSGAQDGPAYGGQIAAGWDPNSSGCSTNKPAYAVNYSLVSGVSGMAQQVSSNVPGGEAGLQRWFKLKPGNRYDLSFAVNSDVALYVQLRDWGPPYTNLVNKEIKPTGGVWKTVTLSGYAPKAASEYVEGGVFFALRGAGTVRIDNVVAVESADATTGVSGRVAAQVPANYFGLHVHRDAKWPTMGKAVAMERIWDTGQQWRNLFPVKPTAAELNDPAKWAALDARLNRAALNGAEALMVLGGSAPDWASAPADIDKCGSRDQAGAVTGNSAPIAEANLGDWQAWVRAVVTRYRGRIKAYEVWNEPYQCPLFLSNPDLLVKQVEMARAIIKEVDPGATVLTPSFKVDDLQWLDRYLLAMQQLAASKGLPWSTLVGDVVSVHAYDFTVGNYLYADRVHTAADDPQSVETIFQREHQLLNFRNQLRQYGDQGVASKPLWVTEWGYLGTSGIGKDAYGQRNTNDVVGAGFLARSLVMMWAAGVDRAHYYAWDQHREYEGVAPNVTEKAVPLALGREVVQTDGKYLITAAGTAFVQVAKWMTGAELIDVKSDAQGTWVATLRRGQALSYIVWNPATNVYWPRPTGLTATSVLDGTTTYSGSSALIKAAPVLLAAPPSVVSITSSASAVAVNAPVTFTVQVSGGYSPKGQVQFTRNGFNFGAPVTLTNGRATYTTTFTSTGNFQVGATYSGDTVNPPVKSASLLETVK